MTYPCIVLASIERNWETISPNRVQCLWSQNNSTISSYKRTFEHGEEVYKEDTQIWGKKEHNKLLVVSLTLSIKWCSPRNVNILFKKLARAFFLFCIFIALFFTVTCRDTNSGFTSSTYQSPTHSNEQLLEVKETPGVSGDVKITFYSETIFGKVCCYYYYYYYYYYICIMTLKATSRWKPLILSADTIIHAMTQTILST